MTRNMPVVVSESMSVSSDLGFREETSFSEGRSFCSGRAARFKEGAAGFDLRGLADAVNRGLRGLDLVRRSPQRAPPRGLKPAAL